MRDSLHHHPCQRCGELTVCRGELEANDDGWPVVICRSFHLDGGQIDDEFLCHGCADATGLVLDGY